MKYNFKAVVFYWPLNIYTYNCCQKEFPPRHVYNSTVLNHSMCEYFNLKVGLKKTQKISMEVNGDL